MSTAKTTMHPAALVSGNYMRDAPAPIRQQHHLRSILPIFPAIWCPVLSSKRPGLSTHVMSGH